MHYIRPQCDTLTAAVKKVRARRMQYSARRSLARSPLCVCASDYFCVLVIDSNRLAVHAVLARRTSGEERDVVELS